MSSTAYTRQAIILAVVAAGLFRLLLGDAFQAYVRPVMFVPLAISTAIIGGLALWSSFGFDEVDDIDDVDGGEDIDEEVFSHDDHGHEHSGIPRIGWWLVVPIACIAIVPLRPLGASSVRESRANEATIRSIEDRTPAVVSADGEMTLLDFVSRVVNEPDTPVPGTVELTGFVSSTDDDGFVLARFVMSCCAADAQPMLVTVRWAGDAPAVDSWVTVEGTHVPPPPDTPPERRIEAENVIVQAESVTEVDEPADPYESY